MRRLVARILYISTCFAAALAGSSALAQTIFPIDRADILAGSRFDLKVEFDAVVDPAKVALTLNGEDQAKIFGKAAEFILREAGADQSALILRDVSLTSAGSYRVQVTDGTATRQVDWEVYETGARRAKNVILFIGDGLSGAHRVAARILSRRI